MASIFDNSSIKIFTIIFLVCFIIVMIFNAINYFTSPDQRIFENSTIILINLAFVFIPLMLLVFFVLTRTDKIKNDDEIKSPIFKSDTVKDLVKLFKKNVKEIEYTDKSNGKKYYLELVSDGLYIDKENMTSFYKCPGGKDCTKKFSDEFKFNRLEYLKKKNPERYEYLIPDYLKNQ